MSRIGSSLSQFRQSIVGRSVFAIMCGCIILAAVHRLFATIGTFRSPTEATLFISAADCSARGEEIRDALASASIRSVRITEIVISGTPSPASARTLDRLFHPVVLRRENVFDRMWLSAMGTLLPVVALPVRKGLSVIPVEYRGEEHANAKFVEQVRLILGAER